MKKFKIKLQPGSAYYIKIRGGRTVKRIFKHTEKRFGDIICYVFTSRLSGEVRGSYNPATEEITLSGKRVPLSEVSVPEYDLILVREVT